MRKRQRYDILADILKLSMKGIKKTPLVYQSNLNFTILKEYLKELTENNLIESFNGQYFTTWKGELYLDKYLEMQNILRFNERLLDIESALEIIDLLPE